jgi:hypothetical protein
LTNTRQNTTSGFRNLRLIKFFNIQGRFKIPSELSPSLERKREKNFNKEKDNNRSDSKLMQKEKNNSLNNLL